MGDFIERTITAASDSPLRTSSNPSKMQTFHKIALLFACVALCASQNQAQEVPDKAVCEADVDDCVSSNTAFKCAMMFKNLTDLPLKVLDIIPDLIAHKDSKAETVGDVLCERAYDAYNFPSEPKFWFTALVEIGAYVSYCGTSWQEVSTGGKHLVLN